MTYLWALSAMSLTLIDAGTAAQTPAEPLAPVETTAPNAADPATDILRLEEDRNERMTVPVMIAGTGPYDFMIDTGSQATAVTHKINKGLNLPFLGTATLVGMASTRDVNMVGISNLTIGKHEVTDLVSPVLSSSHVGADGIIGLDMLQDFRVVIDFRNETIAVQDATKGKSLRGFEIIVRAQRKLGQLLITDAMVEGVRATVIIDTGAQASIANNALRERIRSKRSQEVVNMDVNGVSMIGQMSNVRSLTIEGLTLNNVPLTFADTPAFDALGLRETPVLSLGMQHLELFDRVAIDFSRQRVLFDLPRDVARAMRQARRYRLGGI